MILGIGSDLANIDRIRKILDRHGDRFRDKATQRDTKNLKDATNFILGVDCATMIESFAKLNYDIYKYCNTNEYPM